MEFKNKYYNDFKCVAGQCIFTCCKQWDIAVDDNTFDKWKAIKAPLSGDEGALFTCDKLVTKSSVAGRVMQLDQKKNCICLDENGLCRLVCEYGESAISKTCHTYPRENHNYGGYTEKTIALSCPETVRLLIGESKEGTTKEGTSLLHTNKDKRIYGINPFFYTRDYFLGILDRRDLSPDIALKMIFYIALDMDNKYEELTDIASLGKYFNKIDIGELKEAVEKVNVDFEDSFTEKNELFLDIVDNYRKKGLYKDWIEDLLSYFENSDNYIEDYRSYIDLLSLENHNNNYDNNISLTTRDLNEFLRKILEYELYYSCFLPESDSYSLLLKLQWLAMEYGILKMICFYRINQFNKNSYVDNNSYENKVNVNSYKENKVNVNSYKDNKVNEDSYKENSSKEDNSKGNNCNEKEYTLDMLIVDIVVVYRMMGYTDADIEDYLINSFEEPVWDWGYFALVTD